MVSEIKCTQCAVVTPDPFAAIETTDSKMYLCSKRCFFEFSRAIKENEVKEVKKVVLFKSHCVEEKKA